jgi:hypothetical protein
VTVYDSLHCLLDHERLLFHCDKWRIPAHTFNCLEWCLSVKSLTDLSATLCNMTDSCEWIMCPSGPSADRKQNTHLIGSSFVICISVAMGMRVYQTIVQQRSIPCCHENLVSEALPSRWSYCSFQASMSQYVATNFLLLLEHPSTQCSVKFL